MDATLEGTEKHKWRNVHSFYTKCTLAAGQGSPATWHPLCNRNNSEIILISLKICEASIVGNWEEKQKCLGSVKLTSLEIVRGTGESKIQLEGRKGLPTSSSTHTTSGPKFHLKIRKTCPTPPLHSVFMDFTGVLWEWQRIRLTLLTKSNKQI